MPELSDAVKELIQKAQIVSFDTWKPFPDAAIALFQAANDERRYLSDTDCVTLQELTPKTSQWIPIAQQLRDQVAEIVDEARSGVLTKFPGITAEGGDLYPEFRAEACWRDFWHFLRCITYGIAASRSTYTSQVGLHYMEALYQELNVPLDAMVHGLEGIKTASLSRIPADHHWAIAPYFDHLITHVKYFGDDD